MIVSDVAQTKVELFLALISTKYFIWSPDFPKPFKLYQIHTLPACWTAFYCALLYCYLSTHVN